MHASRPRSPVGASTTVVALENPMDRRTHHLLATYLQDFRRLRVRFKRFAFVQEAFTKIACCIIC